MLAIILLLFGRGKVSGLMGDVAHGVKSFRRGIADDRNPETPLLENGAAATPVQAETPERSTTTV